MTAFVQLTFQFSPLAVTVTEKPGSSAATFAAIAAIMPAKSIAVFMFSSNSFNPARRPPAALVIKRTNLINVCNESGAAHIICICNNI